MIQKVGVAVTLESTPWCATVLCGKTACFCIYKEDFTLCILMMKKRLPWALGDRLRLSKHLVVA